MLMTDTDISDADHLDLADPAVRRDWLAGVRSHFADLAAAALDATEPPGKRDLGRREAKRIVVAASAAVCAALDAAGAPDVDEADRAILPAKIAPHVGNA